MPLSVTTAAKIRWVPICRKLAWLWGALLDLGVRALSKEPASCPAFGDAPKSLPFSPRARRRRAGHDRRACVRHDLRGHGQDLHANVCAYRVRSDRARDNLVESRIQDGASALQIGRKLPAHPTSGYRPPRRSPHENLRRERILSIGQTTYQRPVGGRRVADKRAFPESGRMPFVR